MRFRRKIYCRRRSLKKRARGPPYIYRHKVYLGKKTKQTDAGVVSETLHRILETVGNVIGL